MGEENNLEHQPHGHGPKTAVSHAVLSRFGGSLDGRSAYDGLRKEGGVKMGWNGDMRIGTSA